MTKTLVVNLDAPKRLKKAITHVENLEPTKRMIVAYKSQFLLAK